MGREVSSELCSLRLEPFDRFYSPVVARWVQTPQQLRLLAPGTGPPLTGTKVTRWKKPGGYAFLLACDGETEHMPRAQLRWSLEVLYRVARAA